MLAINEHLVNDMFLSTFMEPTFKTVAVDLEESEDCIYKSEDMYSEWGLLTPPWSPCDSSFDDNGNDCLTLTASEPAVNSPTTRTQNDSFLCSCTSCECSGLDHSDGPVLRDCMWSQTTGLLPPTLIGRQLSDASSDTDQKADGGDCRPCCPAITAVCTNHTDRCVDPKNVFPCQLSAVESRCTESQTQSVLQSAVNSNCSVATSPVCYPDSETSAYCSAFSDDELEEIDVVSVSCSSGETASMVDAGPTHGRRQVLVLPAAESMSAQVAAMHNYSNPRCRPTPSQPRSVLTSVSHCSAKRLSSRMPGRSRRRPRRVHTSAAASSGSDSSSDSGLQDDERHKRAQHNVMERQRRYHLKSHFYSLRDAVPGTRGDGRISKVAILRHAVDHIRELSALREALQAEHSHQRALQERWKWKLSLLNREPHNTALCSA